MLCCAIVISIVMRSLSFLIKWRVIINDNDTFSCPTVIRSHLAWCIYAKQRHIWKLHLIASVIDVVCCDFSKASDAPVTLKWSNTQRVYLCRFPWATSLSSHALLSLSLWRICYAPGQSSLFCFSLIKLYTQKPNTIFEIQTFSEHKHKTNNPHETYAQHRSEMIVCACMFVKCRRI